jgi:hypothetical protein
MTHTIDDLRAWQVLPLNDKIEMTRARIKEWVDHYGLENVCVSFSGGKDSTVLLDIARQDYPEMEAVFIDTGLEFPNVRNFVKSFDNVTWLKPKMNFVEVIKKYGYPMMSKEIAECVSGARTYLKEILDTNKETATISTDRQTDRQIPYAQFYRKVCGLGEYAKSHKGGYDRKYRKLRGLGEFTKRKNVKQTGWVESEIGDNVGVADKGTDDKGEYP